MTLQYLEVKHFRCVASAKLELSAQCNVITGANGSGKTTLLEAIYFLGTGHSFRSSELASLIQTGHSDFLLTGKLDGINHLPSTISIHGRADHSEFKINGESANSLGELVRHFPVQVIDPEIHRLLEDGPVGSIAPQIVDRQSRPEAHQHGVMDQAARLIEPGIGQRAAIDHQARPQRQRRGDAVRLAQNRGAQDKGRVADLDRVADMDAEPADQIGIGRSAPDADFFVQRRWRAVPADRASPRHTVDRHRRRP